MIRHPPEEQRTTSGSSVGGDYRRSSREVRTGNEEKYGRKSINRCDLYDLPVIGDKITDKSPNVIRFYFENFNGIRSGPRGTDKGKYFGKLMETLEVDCFGAAETNLQWNMSKSTPKKLLSLNPGDRTSYACNKHETTTVKQQGGTCLTMTAKYGQYIGDIGTDESGLGRWSWIRIKGNNNLVTTIISAYLPCIPRKQSLLSTYAQQSRYWAIRGINICAKKKCRNDLLQFIKNRKQEGENIILMVDGNESMRIGKLASALREDSVGMRDPIRSRIGSKKFPTWFRGNDQIDAIWISENITATKITFLPFFFSIGDHRGIMMDIPEEILLGNKIIKIPRPTARRLISKRPDVKQKYIKALEQYMIEQDVPKKILQIKKEKNNMSTSCLTAALNHLDHIKTAGMKYAEKRCRKFHMGQVPYNPGLTQMALTVIFWRLMKRKFLGAKVNKKYLKRIAKKINFNGSLNIDSYTQAELDDNIQTTSTLYNAQKKNAWKHRINFLNELIKAAVGTQKGIIKAIRKREEIIQQWRIWNAVKGDNKGGAVTAVEVKRSDRTIKYSTREDVEREIMNCLSKRFSLTNNNSSMSSRFTEVVGYMAEKTGAEQILEGRIPEPLNRDNHIKEFLEQLRIPLQQIPISAKITICDFKRYWKKAKEKTSSSMSGLHFGHYKCAVDSPLLTAIHTVFLHITINKGIPLKRWSSGLSVMLEKIKGNINVEKLRGILLMEADYNFINKLLLGVRVMRAVEHRKAIPEELAGSRKLHEAVEVALNRKLTSDIMRQLRRPGTITGVDAASCYDRIVHSIIILIARHVGLNLIPLLALFGVIQHMKYYVRTGYGESTNMYGGIRNIPFQGTCQGNGASPTYWLLITMIMVRVMYKKGHVMALRYPMTQEELKCMGFVFVDDTDLIVIGTEEDTKESVCHKQQQAMLCWEKTLEITGGALKPSKCYWYLVDFLATRRMVL